MIYIIIFLFLLFFLSVSRCSLSVPNTPQENMTITLSKCCFLLFRDIFRCDPLQQPWKKKQEDFGYKCLPSFTVFSDSFWGQSEDRYLRPTESLSVEIFLPSSAGRRPEAKGPCLRGCMFCLDYSHYKTIRQKALRGYELCLSVKQFG